MRLVIGFLQPVDVLHLASTSTRFQGIARDPTVWGPLLERDFHLSTRSRLPARAAGVLTTLRSISSSVLGGRGGGLAGSAGRAGGAAAVNPMAAPGAGAGANNAGVGSGAGDLGTTSGKGYQTNSSDWGSSRSTRGLSTPSTATTASGSAGNDALQRYKRLYTQAIDKRKDRVREAGRVREQFANLKSRYSLRLALDCVQFGCGMALYPVYLLIWLCLMLARTTGAAPDMSWAAVFAPVIAAILHPCLFACIGAVTERCSQNAGSSGACSGQSDGDEKGNFVAYAAAVKEWYDDRRCKCCRFMLAAAIWIDLLLCPIFLILKLDGHIDCSWPVAMVPIWLLCGLAFLAPCSGLMPCVDDGEDTCAAVGIVSLFVCYCLPTLAVVAAMLAGRAIVLKFALIPLWVLDAFLLLGAAGAGIAACCARGDRSDRAIFTGMSLSMLVLGVVGTVSQIYAAIDWSVGDYEGVSKSLIIGGIVIVVAVCVAWCVLAVVLLKHARDSEFKGLYTRNWLRGDTAVAAAMPAGTAVGNVLRDLVRDVEG